MSKIKKTLLVKIKKGKICSKCGNDNQLNAIECSDCNGKRFEPNWVHAKENINRQFSVQIPKFKSKIRKLRIQDKLKQMVGRGDLPHYTFLIRHSGKK